MGNFQTTNNDQYEEGSSNELKISIDFKKPVVLELKPLTLWSLQQIRQIYAPFRQRKGSPLLSRSQFLRFLRLSRIMSFSLFDRMCIKRKFQLKKDSLNVFEIISILVLTAYTSYTYKVHFLFNVFDLDSSKGLQFKELILSFKSLIIGYCILTDQPLPDNDLLQKYGQIMFSRADLNNDQCLQLGEVLSWFEGNVQGLFLFKRFQPTDVIGKQDYQIFNGFIPYSDAQIKLLYQKIQKEHKKIPLTHEDFQLLSGPVEPTFRRTNSTNITMKDFMNKTKSTNKVSQFKTSRPNVNQGDEMGKSKKVGFNLLTARVPKQKNSRLFPHFSRQASILQDDDYCQGKQNMLISRNSSKIFSKNTQSNSIANSTSKVPSSKQHRHPISIKKTQSTMINSIIQKVPFKQIENDHMKGSKTLRNIKYTKSWEVTALNLSQVNIMKKKLAKKKFQNIIILKGKTITKKYIFDLRDYFENLSAGKKAILIQNFIDSFNEEKYNHMRSVAASLFNFLDIDQNGKVTFKQLIQKLYPDLTPQHYEIIKLWNNEYNQNFNLEKKIKANRQHEELKKRILPKTCIARYKQMFNFFDKDKKGYVDLNDLKRILSDVSTEKQILDTFEDNDKNKDGKLDLKQFMHVLLPADLQIQGI